MNAVDAVEDLLYSQLAAAVGKQLTPGDFAEYMDFHNRQLFKEEYLPRGFSYAVRRPNIYIIFSMWREICTLRNEKLHTEA